MKYIRTKDGIYEKANQTIYKNEELEYIDGYELVKIIKQADTIEELCDEFVSVYGKYQDHWDNLEECLRLCWDGPAEIYGAIWTDRGLIYVAKMNEKGELELL